MIKVCDILGQKLHRRISLSDMIVLLFVAVICICVTLVMVFTESSGLYSDHMSGDLVNSKGLQ